jgi:uncharacterized membrane protein
MEGDVEAGRESSFTSPAASGHHWAARHRAEPREPEEHVSDLVTIGYPDAATARQVLHALDRLQVESAIDVQDAVIVERLPDGQVDVHPWIHQAVLETAASALFGGLIGTLLLAPLLGVALGAAAGATRAALQDLGIPDDFIEQLGRSLPAGGVAIILLADVTQPETVLATLAQHGGRVVQSSLTTEAEQRLRRAVQGGASDHDR